MYELLLSTSESFREDEVPIMGPLSTKSRVQAQAQDASRRRLPDVLDGTACELRSKRRGSARSY